MHYYSLKDFITNRRLFVSLGVSETEKKRLLKYLGEYGIKNNLNHDKDKVSDESMYYHTTLWYSKTGHVNPADLEIPNIKVKVLGWELLGKNNEHLTLKLENHKMIHKIKDEYGTYGLSSEWPSFKPHLTMVYHYNKKLPRFDPPEHVVFNRLFIEEYYDITE